VLSRVRISSDAAGVILSGAFPREDLFSSFYILILEKIQKDEILTSSGRKHRTPQNDGVGG
jgi:hypothetical protein